MKMTNTIRLALKQLAAETLREGGEGELVASITVTPTQVTVRAVCRNGRVIAQTVDEIYKHDELKDITI